MNSPPKEPAMRTHALLAASIMLTASILVPAIGSAQQNPSTDEILKSLTPGVQRGIRLAPAGQQGAPAPQRPSAPSVSLTVEFATGSAELTPQATQVLDRLGKALSDKTLASYRFRIEGHTDTVGARSYNKELSDRRAEALVDYLADNFHVERGHMQAIGMGVDGLLIPTPDQTSEPRNRRVQVVNTGN
jgi:OOP family OmpA-OmpF porin